MRLMTAARSADASRTTTTAAVVYVVINDRLLYSIRLPPRLDYITVYFFARAPTADCAGGGGARETVHAGVADAQKTLSSPSELRRCADSCLYRSPGRPRRSPPVTVSRVTRYCVVDAPPKPT